jgi:hypothetical protein
MAMKVVVVKTAMRMTTAMVGNTTRGEVKGNGDMSDQNHATMVQWKLHLIKKDLVLSANGFLFLTFGCFKKLGDLI